MKHKEPPFLECDKEQSRADSHLRKVFPKLMLQLPKNIHHLVVFQAAVVVVVVFLEDLRRRHLQDRFTAIELFAQLLKHTNATKTESAGRRGKVFTDPARRKCESSSFSHPSRA